MILLEETQCVNLLLTNNKQKCGALVNTIRPGY